MAKKILLGVLGLVGVALVGLLIAAAIQPDSYRVERSRTIGVPPAEIAPHLTDLREFAAWSPWSELDPDMTQTYSDPSSGVDAWYEWTGNDEVGHGKMTITRAGDDGVAYHLEFFEPFTSEAEITISLAPTDDGGSRVVWALDGDNDFMGKMFGLFVDMDEMAGADFERGLQNLERVSTSGG